MDPVAQSSPVPLFDAGVPISDLPWGVKDARARATEPRVESRTFTYHDGDLPLEGYMAWVPELLNDSSRGQVSLPGVVVAHTAIGPQEVFIHSCVDALARLGYCAMALDMFGAGACVFDKTQRDAIMNPLRENRELQAKRGKAGVDALAMQPECAEERGICAIGFCLGGQVVLDIARAKCCNSLEGVVSFHGILDDPKTLKSPKNSNANQPAGVFILHGEEDPFSPRSQTLACLDGLDERSLMNDMTAFPQTKHAFTRPEKNTKADDDAGFQYHPMSAKVGWNTCKTLLETWLCEDDDEDEDEDDSD